MSLDVTTSLASSAASAQDIWQDADDLKACARAWAEKIRVRPRRVQVQRMTKKWASCSRAGTLTFSTDLLQRDRTFGEAVIVHELIHLVAPNHGKLFRSLLSAYLPAAEHVLRGQVACGFGRGG